MLLYQFLNGHTVATTNTYELNTLQPMNRLRRRVVGERVLQRKREGKWEEEPAEQEVALLEAPVEEAVLLRRMVALGACSK